MTEELKDFVEGIISRYEVSKDNKKNVIGLLLPFYLDLNIRTCIDIAEAGLLSITSYCSYDKSNLFLTYYSLESIKLIKDIIKQSKCSNKYAFSLDISVGDLKAIYEGSKE